MSAAKYKRALLKLSGEALMGDSPFGIDFSVLNYVSQQIKMVAGEPLGTLVSSEK